MYITKNLTTLTFGYKFNQKIEPNILPENLINLTFGYDFIQKIDLNILPYNLKNIEFNWNPIRINNTSYVEMVNNIPSYYDVKIFIFSYNILDNNNLKWPIYDNITVLINKKSFQIYSSTKSAIK